MLAASSLVGPVSGAPFFFWESLISFMMPLNAILNTSMVLTRPIMAAGPAASAPDINLTALTMLSKVGSAANAAAPTN